MKIQERLGQSSAKTCFVLAVTVHVYISSLSDTLETPVPIWDPSSCHRCDVKLGSQRNGRAATAQFFFKSFPVTFGLKQNKSQMKLNILILSRWLVYFSRMRSEGSRFTWGSGGEAVFAEFCVCVRNRSQVSATVCVSAVRLSTVASVSGVVSKACQVELWRHSYIGVCSGGVCGIDLCRRNYIGVCRGGV